MQRFIVRYPGTLPATSASPKPELPISVGVQHFFNLFLLIFIIRSGVQILSDHPRLYWTRHSTPGKDWFRIQKPVPDDPLWTEPVRFGNERCAVRLDQTRQRTHPRCHPRSKNFNIATLGLRHECSYPVGHRSRSRTFTVVHRPVPDHGC